MDKLKEKLKKIQEFFTTDKFNDIISEFKNADYKAILQNIVQKLKSIRKEDIKLFYLSYKNTAWFVLFSFLSLMFLILLVIDLKNLYLIRKEIASNLMKVELVSDKKIKTLIKTNKLRTLNTLADTIYVKAYDRFDSKKYSQLLNNVKVFVLLSMLYDKNNLYSNYVKTLLLSNNLSIAKNPKLLVKNLSILSKKIDYSDPTIVSYISNFPKSKNILNNKVFELYSKVLNNLYEYELISIFYYQNKLFEKLKHTYENYQAPYKYFLTYFYFPRMNIWINPYSEKVNPNIFGSKYLHKAGYIDLNLIKYWSNFFSQSYSGLLYQGEKNTITDIKLSDIKLDKKNNLANVGLNVKFQLPDDKSFYGLISKLTLTSNIKNIMLLNEFTYYLWNNIKSHLNAKLANVNIKASLGNKLMYLNLKNCLESSDNNCLVLFGCTDLANGDKADVFDNFVSNILNSGKINEKNLFSIYDHIINKLQSNPNYKLTNSTFYRFIKNGYQNINDIDVLIGARLYDCIKENGYCGDIFDKNYTQIVKAIKQFADCENKDSLTVSDSCKMKFIEKFNTNYFIAYTMVDRLGEIEYPLLQRLKDVYTNIPNVLQLGKFMFTKLTNTNLNGNMLVKYTSDVNLSIFYKYISQPEYDKILSYIGQQPCKSVTNGKEWSLSVAYSYVNNKYNQLYKTNLGADEIYNLKKLLSIIKSLQDETKKAPLLDKLLANLQVYRIFETRGYCK